MQHSPSQVSSPSSSTQSSVTPPKICRYSFHLDLSPNAKAPVFLEHTYTLLASALQHLSNDPVGFRCYDMVYNFVSPSLTRHQAPLPFTPEVAFQSYLAQDTQRVCISNEMERPETGVVIWGEVNANETNITPTLNGAVVESYEDTFRSGNPSPQTLHRRAIIGIVLSVTLYHELAHSWLQHILVKFMSTDKIKLWKNPGMGHSFGKEVGVQLEAMLFHGSFAVGFHEKEDKTKIDRFDQIDKMWFKPAFMKDIYCAPALDSIQRLYDVLVGIDISKDLTSAINQFIRSVPQTGIPANSMEGIVFRLIPPIAESKMVLVPLTCGTHMRD